MATKTVKAEVKKEAKAEVKAETKKPEAEQLEKKEPLTQATKAAVLQEQKPAFQDGALGMVETRGLVAAIEAADIMVKSANVVVVGTEKIGSGLVCVIVRGDVSAVVSAVESGSEAAARLGEVFASHVIARPHSDISKILPKF